MAQSKKENDFNKGFYKFLEMSQKDMLAKEKEKEIEQCKVITETLFVTGGRDSNEAPNAKQLLLQRIAQELKFPQDDKLFQEIKHAAGKFQLEDTNTFPTKKEYPTLFCIVENFYTLRKDSTPQQLFTALLTVVKGTLINYGNNNNNNPNQMHNDSDSDDGNDVDVSEVKLEIDSNDDNEDDIGGDHDEKQDINQDINQERMDAFPNDGKNDETGNNVDLQALINPNLVNMIEEEVYALDSLPNNADDSDENDPQIFVDSRGIRNPVLLDNNPDTNQERKDALPNDGNGANEHAIEDFQFGDKRRGSITLLGNQRRNSIPDNNNNNNNDNNNDEKKIADDAELKALPNHDESSERIMISKKIQKAEDIIQRMEDNIKKLEKSADSDDAHLAEIYKKIEKIENNMQAMQQEKEELENRLNTLDIENNDNDDSDIEVYGKTGGRMM